ncbi:hypothetical protein F5148DRAFT_918797 [Russula earlei]|uniref:Uncharacterized protein n=1 Tax=Russula earlei TaxID=71964 RepID=A0ACC0U9G2_9AGAM|nr:hypothetical protein F5148DRAFT_918797 [Russula earlei]
MTTIINKSAGLAPRLPRGPYAAPAHSRRRLVFALCVYTKLSLTVSTSFNALLNSDLRVLAGMGIFFSIRTRGAISGIVRRSAANRVRGTVYLPLKHGADLRLRYIFTPQDGPLACLPLDSRALSPCASNWFLSSSLSSFSPTLPATMLRRDLWPPRSRQKHFGVSLLEGCHPSIPGTERSIVVTTSHGLCRRPIPGAGTGTGTVRSIVVTTSREQIRRARRVAEATISNFRAAIVREQSCRRRCSVATRFREARWRRTRAAGRRGALNRGKTSFGARPTGV